MARNLSNIVSHSFTMAILCNADWLASIDLTLLDIMAVGFSGALLEYYLEESAFPLIFLLFLSFFFKISML